MKFVLQDLVYHVLSSLALILFSHSKPASKFRSDLELVSLCLSVSDSVSVSVFLSLSGPLSFVAVARKAWTNSSFICNCKTTTPKTQKKHAYIQTSTTQNPPKKKCTYRERVQQSLQQIREEKQARNARKARWARACALDVCACARACAHWVALEEGTGVRGGVGES